MKTSRLLPLMFASLAAGLSAASGSGAGEAAHHGVDWLGVLGKVLNSAILFGGLFLALRKPLIQMLTQKGAGLRQEFAERESSLAATEERLRGIDQRLQRVAAEIEGIQAAADAAGRAELERLEETGRREAERIVAFGEEEIRQRVDAAVRSIKARIADLAVARFREDLAESLDDATQQAILERNIDAAGELTRSATGIPHGSPDAPVDPRGGADEGK